MSFLLLTTRILEQVRERPSMYFQPPVFHALSHYIDGCHDALRQFVPSHPFVAEFDGFDAWLCSHFGISLPSFRWRQIVWERASEDKEQIRLFVDLYLAYRRERGIDPFAPSPARQQL